MAGDYALSYSHTTILCHGVRQDQGNALTHERAVTLAKNLAVSNEQYALLLAGNCIARLIFRIVFLRSGFAAIRARPGQSNFSDASCFIQTVSDRLPPPLIQLMKNALIQSLENDILDYRVNEYFQKIGSTGELRRAEFEAHILRAILDFEIDEHKEQDDWSFRIEGFEKIEERLVLLLDKHAERHQSQVKVLCERWGEFFLTTEEEAELKEIGEEERPRWLFERVEKHLRPIWFFFVSVCRLLQEDDYYLTADQAYWMGFLDEVIGRPDLPSPRIFVEHAPEPASE